MMHCMKLMLFVSVFFAGLVSADDSAKTAELQRYVKNHEQQVRNLRENIARLKSHCFLKIVYYEGDKRITSTYISPLTRHSDLEELYYSLQKLKDLPQTTEKTLDNLLQQGAKINELDSLGNSPLNYAQSHTMYTALRSRGADFKIMPFVSAHPWTIGTISTLACLALYTIYKQGYFAINRYADYDLSLCPENSLHVRDVYGRTPLMNYVIVQEDKLVALRAQLNELKDNSQQEHAFYAGLVQYQKLLEETLKGIEKMIQQDAELNIKDCDGKSLINYCHTIDVYNALRSAGAPFEISSGFYFSRMKLSLICFCALPFIWLASEIQPKSAFALNKIEEEFQAWYCANCKKR